MMIFIINICFGIMEMEMFITNVEDIRSTFCLHLLLALILPVYNADFMTICF